MKMIALLLTLFAAAPAAALDPACTTTTNLVMARCPDNSEDWYESYTDIIDELDILARTAKSSFTVIGPLRASSYVDVSSLTATYGVRAATMTANDVTIIYGLTVGTITAVSAVLPSVTSSFSVTNTAGIRASSGNFTGGDANNAYSVTTASGIHILAGQLRIENGATIRWPDGTVTSTSPGGGGGGGATQPRSTETWITVDTSMSAATPFGVCLATATRVTLSAHKLKVKWHFPEVKQTANQDIELGFLLDSDFLYGTKTATVKGRVQYRFAGNQDNYDSWTGEWPIPSTAAGTHNVCLIAVTSGGTSSLVCGTRGPCWFGFEEDFTNE